MSKNTFFTKFSELSGNRFDPLFYSGEIKGFFNTIKYPMVSLYTLVEHIESGIGAGKDDQSDETIGVLHIRPTNINKYGYLLLTKNIYIPTNNKLSKVKPNDILFNNTNSQELVGKTLFIEKEIEAYFSNHITKIQVNDKINAKYLWIILNLYQKKRIFYNLCTNWNNQSGVGLDVLKSLQIPLPKKNIQSEIILKIKESDKLKAKKENEAQKKLNSIDEYLLNELNLNIQSNEKEDLADRVFIRKLSQISGDRFDSDYYRNYFYQNINQLKENKVCKLMTLGDITKNIFQGLGQNLTDKKENILLKVKNIQNDNKINFDDIEFIEDVPKSKILLDNDIITPFIGEAIKKYKFSVFIKPKNNYNYTVDNNTGVIRLKDKYNSIYISAFLMSSIGKMLIKQLSGGGGVPFLGSNSASKLYIPIPIKDNIINFEKQDSIARHIKKLRDEAQVLKDEANKIYEDSKREVEKMILGDDL
jgi:type I restriction enzyme S subunit